MMAVFPKRLLGASLAALFLLPSVGHALERFDRLPEGRTQWHLRVLHEPTSEEAFDAGGNRRRWPVLLSGDPEVAALLEGSVSRSRTELQVRYDQALSDRTAWGLKVPLVQSTQQADLSVTTGDATLQQSAEWVQEATPSETLSGVGDARLFLRHELSLGLNRVLFGGLVATLPTGASDTARGLYGHTLGSGQGALTGFLQNHWMPTTPGWRNVLSVSLTNQLAGTRQNLAGDKVLYAPGNQAEAEYGWSWEQDNWHYGFNWHHLQQQPATLGGQQFSPRVLQELTLEVGLGTLSDLEAAPQEAPWQVLLQATTPTRGENVPATQRLTVSWVGYFW